MDRDAAYTIVCGKLRECSELGYEGLVARVGQAANVESLKIGGQMIEFEVRVLWEDSKRRKIVVEAVAYGPSCFRIERVEEKIIVAPPG